MSINITGDESWENDISIHSTYDHVVGNNDEGLNDGSDDGRSNVPLRQLANRTIALKEKLENYGIEVEDNPISQMLPGLSGPRHCIQSYGNGIDIESATVACVNDLNEAGNATSRAVNFGFNMLDGNYGGMTIFKVINISADWKVNSTLFDEISQNFSFIHGEGIRDNPEGITAFTATGVTVGTDNHYNRSAEDHFELGFSTTHHKQLDYENVKSISFDIEENHGNAVYVGVRSIEFYYRGIKITLNPSEYTTYAEDTFAGTYNADYIFDTSLNKVGSSAASVEWRSEVLSQRILLVFNNPITFDRIVVNNSHDSGGSTNIGIRSVNVRTSEGSDMSQLYAEYGDNETDIFIGLFKEHSLSDTIDNASYCKILWEYNPASGFFMMLYDGTSGYNNINNITSTPPIFCSAKSLSDSIYVSQVFTDKTGGYNYLKMHSDDAKAYSSNSFVIMDGVYMSFGTNSGLNNSAEEYFTWGFVGDDLSHLSPGMTGIQGSTACKYIVEGGTFDCGMTENEISCILIKRTDDIGNWQLFPFEQVTSGVIENYLILNKNDPSFTTTPNPIIISGSEITIDSAWVGNHVVLVIGKNGTLTSGQTININADTTKPFVATVADGFCSHGQKDYLVKEEVTKNLSFIESDGLYTLYVDKNNTYTLGPRKLAIELPEFDFTPGVMRGNGKLPISDITILNGDITDCDVRAIGDKYTTPWWPIDKNTTYFIKNVFNDKNVIVTLLWKQYYDSSGLYHVDVGRQASDEYGTYITIYSTRIYVRTGSISPFTSNHSGGFYRLIIERPF